MKTNSAIKVSKVVGFLSLPIQVWMTDKAKWHYTVPPWNNLEDTSDEYHLWVGPKSVNK